MERKQRTHFFWLSNRKLGPASILGLDQLIGYFNNHDWELNEWKRVDIYMFYFGQEFSALWKPYPILCHEIILIGSQRQFPTFLQFKPHHISNLKSKVLQHSWREWPQKNKYIHIYWVLSHFRHYFTCCSSIKIAFLKWSKSWFYVEQ